VAVTVGGVTYQLSSPEEVNVQINYATILGIPRPYFWVLLAGIIAAIVIVPVVKIVSYVRLPPIVKRLNEIQKIIRSRKSVRSVNVHQGDTSKYLEEKFGYRWKAYNISMSRKLKESRSIKEIAQEVQKAEQMP
jgi:hypothetical protein